MIDFVFSILIIISRGIKKIHLLFRWLYTYFNRANEIKQIRLFPSQKKVFIPQDDNISVFKLLSTIPKKIKKENEGIILKIKTYDGIKYLFIKFDYDDKGKTTPCNIKFNINPYDVSQEIIPTGFIEWFSKNHFLNQILQQICNKHIVIINEKPYWKSGINTSWISSIDDSLTMEIYSLCDSKKININEKKIIKEI